MVKALTIRFGNESHSNLALDAKFTEFLTELDDGNSGEGKDNGGDTRQLPIPIENHRGESDDGKGIPQDAGQRAGNGALDEGDVIGEPGYEDARWRFGKKGEGEVLEVMIELFPQIGHDALTDKAHEVCLAIVEDSLNEIEPHDDSRYEE
jgi:hypothetical protein